MNDGIKPENRMMTTEVYDIDTVDKLAWGDLLERSVIKDVYQTYEWASLMKELYAWEPQFLVLSHNGKAVASQLFFRKKVFGVFNACEALGGPLYTGGFGEEVISSLIEFLRGLKTSPMLYRVIRPQCPHDFELLFKKARFIVNPFQTFLLNLDRPAHEIWKSFIQNARWGVRKAEKLGVSVAEAAAWEEWEAFMNIHIPHSKAHGTTTKSPEFFRGLYENFYPKNMARVFVSKHEGKIIAGMLFLVCRDMMVYYMGASEHGSLSLSPNDPIMWHAIQWGKDNGIRLLNLEDTHPDPSSNLYGIHKFKEKWSGELVHRDLYIDGRFYALGQSLLLNSRTVQRVYAFLHKRNII